MSETFHVLRSAPCWFQWGPWRANSVALERSGWRFEQRIGGHYGFGTVEIYMHHRELGMAGLAVAEESVLMYSARRGYGADEVVFMVTRMTAPDKFVLEREQPPMTRSISMEPEMAVVRRFTINDLFAARAEPQQEIIVEPQTVAGLLEQIKKLQAPELAAIRERNRRMDETRHLKDQDLPQRTHEVVVPAQIVTLRKVA